MQDPSVEGCSQDLAYDCRAIGHVYASAGLSGDWADKTIRDRYADDVMMTSLLSAQMVVCQVQRIMRQPSSTWQDQTWSQLRPFCSSVTELSAEAEGIVHAKACGPRPAPRFALTPPKKRPLKEALASSSSDSLSSDSDSASSSVSVEATEEFRALGSKHRHGRLHLAAVQDLTFGEGHPLLCACGRTLHSPDVIVSVREACGDVRTWSPRCASKVPAKFRALLGL